MTHVQQIQDDLRFVRDAVDRRERMVPPPAGLYWVWAAYVLIGYLLIDVAPRASGWFFLLAFPVAGAMSGWLGKLEAAKTGVVDRAAERRRKAHFIGGTLLSLVFAWVLAVAIPALRNQYASQVAVVMIGLVYFLAGVHFDRNFLWLGPVMMLGGAFVGYVPHYGWTALGAVIAAGLVVPTLLPAHRPPGMTEPQTP